MNGRERLRGIGVDKLTLGWIFNTLYECGLDSSGTRMYGGGFFENDNELSVSITKLKKDYDGEGNEKAGYTRQENIKQYIRTNGITCNM